MVALARVRCVLSNEYRWCPVGSNPSPPLAPRVPKKNTRLLHNPSLPLPLIRPTSHLDPFLPSSPCILFPHESCHRPPVRIGLQGLGRDQGTLAYLVDLFKGAKTAKCAEKGHNRLEGYGAGSKYTKHDAERLGMSCSTILFRGLVFGIAPPVAVLSRCLQLPGSHVLMCTITAHWDAQRACGR